MPKFNPADFSAYSYSETGVPTRITPAARGKRITHPKPRVRKSDGREVYSLLRDDGRQVTVSRDLIRAHVNPAPYVKPEPPAGSAILVNGFPDYAWHFASRTLYRFQSPAMGVLVPPIVIKQCEINVPGYSPYYRYRVQDADGARRNLCGDKIVAALGMTLREFAVASRNSVDSPAASV